MFLQYFFSTPSTLSARTSTNSRRSRMSCSRQPKFAVQIPEWDILHIIFTNRSNDMYRVSEYCRAGLSMTGSSTNGVFPAVSTPSRTMISIANGPRCEFIKSQSGHDVWCRTKCWDLPDKLALRLLLGLEKSSEERWRVQVSGQVRYEQSRKRLVENTERR